MLLGSGVWLGVWQAAGFQLGAVTVPPRDLAYSVGRHAGSPSSDGRCVRHDREWRCPAADQSSSESADYEVRLDGRCWSADRIGPRPDATEGGLHDRVTGCVGFRDHVRIFERVFAGSTWAALLVGLVGAAILTWGLIGRSSD
jgi:hypothetical protein